ncbi:hypothetical protein LCGC14_2546470 [marine sediment metagenome]|uniref:HD domain-containing protein n=1 Tax=marine sediment metagenome TaxID=412755 RepID=A0A0F9DHA0_9ZZZZ
MRSLLLDRGATNVSRWHCCPTLIAESDATHHSNTARIAYAVAWELRRLGIRKINPAEVASLANVHDEGETIVGDMPATVKHLFKNARRAQQRYESRAVPMLFEDAPGELRYHLQSMVRRANNYSTLEGQVVRYADSMDALAYAEQEVVLGNKLMEETRQRCERVCAGYNWRWLKRLKEEYPDLA